jgi:fatty acid desaturase
MMLVVGNAPLGLGTVWNVFLHWMLIEAIGSFLYTLFAVNNGHHGPDIVHEGDEFESLDFGVFQIKAIVDRQETEGNIFTVLGYYGLHALHHLFPTLDHAVLPKLLDIFNDTCKEFSVESKTTTIMGAMARQFEQLARSETKKLN